MLAPYDEIAEADGGILADAHALTDPRIFARAARLAGYLGRWRERFDYAVMVDADAPGAAPFAPPEGMTLVRDEGFARLYRIDRRPAALTPSAMP